MSAGVATASPAPGSPAPQAASQHHTGGHGLEEEAAQAFCRGVEAAARQGVVLPEPVLALCKQVNGWD
ncbi:hypothetical protein [Streptomyces sp. NPDC002133]|uniref:hypothetical protein n=1 Tax=Streptomyces sp. NPDC002133 TaxID=3154409 RepID=UPI00331BFCF1